MNLELVFNCDRDAKELVGSLLTDYLTSTYDRVVTSAATGEYEPVDITLTSITPSGQARLIAVEIKERQAYTVYDPEFCNQEKEKGFNRYRNSGYTILWASLYPKAWRLIVWNYDSTPKKKLNQKFRIKRHTVLDDERIEQERLGMCVDDAILDWNLCDPVFARFLRTGGDETHPDVGDAIFIEEWLKSKEKGLKPNDTD